MARPSTLAAFAGSLVGRTFDVQVEVRKDGEYAGCIDLKTIRAARKRSWVT